MSVKDVVGKIEKRFGKEAVSRGNDKVQFIHSGSVLLDEALGGGWAIGRIIEVYGAESCGKTTAAIHVAAEVQKLGKAVGYVDVEQAMDPDYIQSLGVDMSEDKWILSQPDDAEQALEIVREMCEEPAIGLVVLDSVAGLVPKAVLQGEAGDAKVALVARLMSSQLNVLKNIRISVCRRPANTPATRITFITIKFEKPKKDRINRRILRVRVMSFPCEKTRR